MSALIFRLPRKLVRLNDQKLIVPGLCATFPNSFLPVFPKSVSRSSTFSSPALLRFLLFLISRCGCEKVRERRTARANSWITTISDIFRTHHVDLNDSDCNCLRFRWGNATGRCSSRRRHNFLCNRPALLYERSPIQVAFFGLIFNMLGITVVLKNPILKNSFGSLCLSHSIANSGVLFVFFIWAAPATYMWVEIGGIGSFEWKERASNLQTSSQHERNAEQAARSAEHSLLGRVCLLSPGHLV